MSIFPNPGGDGERESGETVESRGATAQAVRKIIRSAPTDEWGGREAEWTADVALQGTRTIRWRRVRGRISRTGGGMDGSSQRGRATAAGGGDAVLHTLRLHVQVENSKWLHCVCVEEGGEHRLRCVSSHDKSKTGFFE